MTNNELPAFIEETGLVADFGEWKLEAVEGDHATLDFTASMSNEAEVRAAIAALTALLPKMRAATEFVGH